MRIYLGDGEYANYDSQQQYLEQLGITPGSYQHQRLIAAGDNVLSQLPSDPNYQPGYEDIMRQIPVSEGDRPEYEVDPRRVKYASQNYSLFDYPGTPLSVNPNMTEEQVRAALGPTQVSIPQGAIVKLPDGRWALDEGKMAEAHPNKDSWYEPILRAMPMILGAAVGAAGLGAGPLAGGSTLAEAGGLAGGAALPESYWSATAGGGAASDAAAVEAGTMGGSAAGGGFSPFAENAIDLADAAGSNTISGYGAAGPLGAGTQWATPTAAALYGGAAPAVGGLSSILKNGGSVDDWLKVGGAVAPGVLGYLGAGNTQDSLKQIYDQQRADRAPALAKYNEALNNPNEFYNSAPAMGSVDAILRKLSTQGNPAANPGLLSQAASYNLGGYNNYLSGLAGPAFGGQATQAQLGTNMAQAGGGQYDAVGLGLSRLLNPTPSPSDTAAKYGLTIGGVKV